MRKYFALFMTLVLAAVLAIAGTAMAEDTYTEGDWELRTLEDGRKEAVEFLNKGATEAVFPDGISSIGEDVFKDCNSLISVTMDGWMTNVDYGNILLLPRQTDYDTYKTTCAVAYCVSFGHYPQRAEGTEDMPIQWIVLRKEGSKALLLSRYALDAGYYDDPNRMHSDGRCWENSQIRQWLNGEFLHRAFTEDEQSCILQTNVDNSVEQGYSDWTLEYSPDTVDQVFLLSINEAIYLLPEQMIKCCFPTLYIDDAYRVSDTPFVYWWLRSPGPHPLYPAVVSPEGEISNSSILSTCPIRPAIWVNTESVDGLSQTMSLSELYNAEGEAALSKGLWDEARQAFYRLNDSEQVNAIYYAEGMEKFNEGDMEGALQAFRSADGYSDADLKVSEISYAVGVAKRGEGDWDGAIKAFTDAGEYEDAAIQITETRYQQAQSLIAENKNDEAISILETIKDYKDSQALMQMHCFTFEIVSDEECYLTEYIGNLSEVVIPKCDGNGRYVTRIGYDAFRYCGSITKITIPDSVTNIMSYAFAECTALTSITIPASLTGIGEGAFWRCTSLTGITIPDSVTFIGRGAFADCASLTSITIPDSVTTIGANAFSGCTSLTSITIPDSVTAIGEGAFSGCTSLASITIPNSVTVIEGRTFQHCTSITSITIPDGVTTIGAGAFKNCTSLTYITIPDSVKDISEYGVFEGCTSLACIIIPPHSYYIEDYARENHLPYNYVNVNTVTAEDNSALWELRTLEDGTKEAVAFLNLMASEAVIPEGVNSIGSGVFSRCTSLTSITIPDSVTIIRENAFTGCQFTSITIPDSVTTIEPHAFMNCFSLTSITIPDSVTSIGRGAFWQCTSLTSITISDSVTSIGESAFGNCTSLTSVTIPDSVTSIEEGTFGNCTSLTSITIPNSVTSIGERAFKNCTSLTSIAIPDSVTSIADSAFSGCTSLANITGSEYALNKFNEMQAAGIVPVQSTQAPRIDVADTDFPVDSYLVLGCYEQDGDSDNGPEPLEWLVLKREGSYALIISRMLLSSSSYDGSELDTEPPVSWAESSIRGYVTRIVQSALTQAEQACLVPVEHDGVTDTAFLLSSAEVEELLPIPDFRLCKITKVARRESERMESGYSNMTIINSNGSWWLRDINEQYPDAAALVWETGEIRSIDRRGFMWSRCHTYVRPAIYIDLSFGYATPAE